jgi:DinB superfamily
LAQSHQNRIHATVSAFQSASEGLIAAMERLDDEAAVRVPPGGGWNPAQIGYHVASANEYLAGILAGSVRRSRPAPEGFLENPHVFSGLPSKIQTFPALEPPSNASRAQAIAKLRDSTAQVVQAIEGLSVERAAGEVIDFPFGLISLYQLAEFLTRHVLRHEAQLQRATVAV